MSRKGAKSRRGFRVFTPQVKRVTKPTQKSSSIKTASQLMKEKRYDEAREAFEEILEH